MKQRVFVSSVMDGFTEHREAARRGIEAAGGEPVLIEDYPSLATSSRNACLDAVDSSDIYIAIIGHRGGWKAPSGKLVVEEEFDEAQKLGLPVFVFLQNTEQDSDAKELSRRLSDYVSGYYRKTYDQPEKLGHLVAEALKPHMEGTRSTVDIEWLAERVRPQKRGYSSGKTQVQLVLISERSDEVIDPVKLESSELETSLFELGTKSGLLSHKQAKDIKVKTSSVVLTQLQNGRGSQTPDVVFELTSTGSLNIVTDVVSSINREGLGSYTLTSTMVVLEDDLRATLERCLGFAAAFYKVFDPFGRHAKFAYNVVLRDLGFKNIVNSAPAQGSSISMRGQGEQDIKAFDRPRSIGRRDLDNYQEQIDASVTMLRRQSSTNR